MTIPNTTVVTVPASELREGDFITGLGNGYVIDVETDPDQIPPATDGRNYIARDEGMVMITFHDANGSENELIAHDDLPVTVAREN